MAKKAKKTEAASKKGKEEVKNIRLFVPQHIYLRLKKYQAKKIMNDEPAESLAAICIELIDKGTKKL